VVYIALTVAVLLPFGVSTEVTYVKVVYLPT
jgi:hypothetical protein